MELRDIAVLLAREAGEMVREGRSRGVEVAGVKSSAIDIVTTMDLAAEAHLRTRLAELRPDDAILGEEGDDTSGTSGITWILDPIDGTVNYLYGLPHYGVSVAAVSGPAESRAWTAEAGAVFEGGAGVVWSAARGHGAFRDGERLAARIGPTLEQALLGTGFQYVAERRIRQGGVVTELLGKVRDIRRLGASSIDLCMVAAGRLDAYYEHGLNAWDFAAAALIAQEAGVRVEGFDGDPASEAITIAAWPETFSALHDALDSAGGRLTW